MKTNIFSYHFYALIFILFSIFSFPNNSLKAASSYVKIRKESPLKNKKGKIKKVKKQRKRVNWRFFAAIGSWSIFMILGLIISANFFYYLALTIPLAIGLIGYSIFKYSNVRAANSFLIAAFYAYMGLIIGVALARFLSRNFE